LGKYLGKDKKGRAKRRKSYKKKQEKYFDLIEEEKDL